MVNTEIRLIILYAAKDGEALYSQQKSPKMQYLDTISKRQMISVHFQGKPSNITVIQVYAPTNNAKEAELNGPMKNYKTF